MSGILDFLKSLKRVLQKIVFEVPIWSVYSGYIPDFTLALPFKQLIPKRKGTTVLRTRHPPRGLKGVEMGHIREKDLSNGDTRFYAEVQLKGFPRLTATFSRKRASAHKLEVNTP
jgi:hypothetical protein